MPQLKQEQFLPIPIQQAWDFFATPVNLDAITPTAMKFKTTSELPNKIYEGLIITYKLKPMLNMTVNWVTEITHVREPYYFADEQRKGPYAIWHHEHHFQEAPGGVIMTDILYYHIGKSFFGWLAGRLFVHRKVKEIFDYRYKVLETHFKKK
jgi:ligand-binding SRPBCC domain-containing protein